MPNEHNTPSIELNLPQTSRLRLSFRVLFLVSNFVHPSALIHKVVGRQTTWQDQGASEFPCMYEEMIMKMEVKKKLDMVDGS